MVLQDFSKRILRRLKNYRNRLILPPLSYAAVIDNEPITIIEPVDKPGGLTLEELAIVIGICRKLGDCEIFELGAFRGRTSVNIAFNCEKCRITTFDLPLDVLGDETLEYRLLEKDKDVAGHGSRGYFFEKYREYEDRISHLYGDSASFDFSPYYSHYDLVLIDASHKYENVMIDSENALKLLKANGGIILWHDYSLDHSDVVKAVHDIKDRLRVGIFHIKRTKLAYLSVA